MTIDDIKKDTKHWQRMLKLAGYYTGKIDGIRGPLTQEAEMHWETDQARVLRKHGELDARSERNLMTLLPEAQDVMRPWLVYAIAYSWRIRGLKMQVIEGTRSYAEQDELYAKGRTKKGAKVTNAKGGYSLHNFGVAIDIGLFDARGKYLEDDKEYDLLAMNCPPPPGMEWGGSWKSLHDAPHYQLSKWGSTAKEIRKHF